MNQKSISQSTENENEVDGQTLVSVNSSNGLKRLLQDLDELPVKPTPIYLDATGLAKDELIDLHIFVPSNTTLYTVNVRRLGDATFSVVGNSKMSLRMLLESTDIPKVGFDIRDLSRVLFHRFNVSVTEVHDIQLLELASRKGGQQKKFLSGLASCIDQDISNEDPDKIRWHNPDDPKDIRLYQASGHAPYWIMKRVEMFPALWEVYNAKFSKPKNAVWLHLAKQESEQRVHDGKKKRNKAGTEKKSWAPEVFWDDEQKQMAKDVWKESVVLNGLMGDMEIGPDYE